MCKFLSKPVVSGSMKEVKVYLCADAASLCPHMSGFFVVMRLEIS